MDEDPAGDPGLQAAAGLVALCRLKHVPTDRGAAYHVAGEAVALFRSGDRVFAVEDWNPYTGRAIAGGRVSLVGRSPVVVSPMYRLVFDLRTGACLNAVGLPQQRLRTFDVELVGDIVHVGAQRHATASGGATGRPVAVLGGVGAA